VDTGTPRSKSRAGKPAKLKALPLSQVTIIEPSGRMSMRACRPRRGTIARWHVVGDRLADLIENRNAEPSWDSLAPDLQETLCVEFLREHSISQLPRLAYLLMPFGRTLADVDIVGMDTEHRRIIAQVTHYDEKAARDKIGSLREYAGKNNVLVLFCRASGLKQTEGILVVPVEWVWLWANTRPQLVSSILGM